MIHHVLIALGLVTKITFAYDNESAIDYFVLDMSLNISTNFSTFTPSMYPTYQPSVAPSYTPSVSPTHDRIYIEESFEQTLIGRDLIGMTRLQRYEYQNFLMNSTTYYGMYGGEPLVQTNCTIRQQILEDNSMEGGRRLLNTKNKTFSTTTFDPFASSEDLTPTNLTLIYVMRWSSIYEYLNMTDYTLSFLEYMNSLEGRMRNIYQLQSLGISVTNITSLEIYVPPVEEEELEIVINYSDVSSWNVLAVTGLFTLFCTVIFLIIYEVGRRNPIVSIIFDKRRTCHPQRTPPPLRKDRYFQWFVLKTDIRLFQLSDGNDDDNTSTDGPMCALKEECKEEIGDESTCNITFDTSHSACEVKVISNEAIGAPRKTFLSVISERIDIYRGLTTNDTNSNNSNTGNNTSANFVCVNGRHVPPQFAESAISGLLTEAQLNDCEKNVMNTITEAKKKSSRTSIFRSKTTIASYSTDEEEENNKEVIDCESCKERADPTSKIDEQTNHLKCMIEKGKHDFSIEDILLLQSVGLDQFVFIRFLRFCFDVTFYPFVVTCFTLIPIYYTNPYEGTISYRADTPSIVTDGYFRITMNRLENGSHRLYACFIFAFLYRIFLLYRLWVEWDSFYSVRCEFLSNGDSEMIVTQHGYKRTRIPMSEQIRQFRHSVMVQSIPKSLRGNKELFDFFNQVFPGQVKRVELILTCPYLRQLIAKRQGYIEAYEKVYAKHHYRKERYRARLDAQRSTLLSCFNKEPVEPMIRINHAKFPKLSYYMNEIKSLNILANNERLKLEQQKVNVVNEDMNFSNHIHKLRSMIAPVISNEFASGTAFVEFNTLATVQSAIQCNITGSRNCMVIASAPDPRELKWKNVAVDRELLRYRYLLSNCMLLIGTLFWSPLVTLVTSYSDIDLLEHYLPSWMIPRTNTFMHAFIQGYLPVLVLETLMIFVVMALRMIAKYYIRFKTASDNDRFVFLWHFGYRLANIFIVIVSGSIKEVVYAIQTDFGNFFVMITQGFSYSSQFFLDNVIFAAGNGNFFELAQIVKIVKCLFFYKFVKSGATSKRVLKRVSKADRLEWGECLPEFVFTLMVAMMYCTSAPIILGACALCFFLASKVYLHQALYVYSPKYESGGMFMYYLNRATFVTLYITNAMFGLLLGMKGKEYLGTVFFLLTTGGTIMVDLRIRSKYIVPSTKLALVNARMIDEKSKEDQENEKGASFDTTSEDSLSHIGMLEAFSYDPRYGDSVGFISPSVHEASRFERTKQDHYIYTQPELNINAWETGPHM